MIGLCKPNYGHHGRIIQTLKVKGHLCSCQVADDQVDDLLIGEMLHQRHVRRTDDVVGNAPLLFCRVSFGLGLRGQSINGETLGSHVGLQLFQILRVKLAEGSPLPPIPHQAQVPGLRLASNGALKEGAPHYDEDEIL